LNELGIISYYGMITRRESAGVVVLGSNAKGEAVLLFFNRSLGTTKVLMPSNNSNESFKPRAISSSDNIYLVCNRLSGQNKTLSLIMVDSNYKLYCGELAKGYAEDVQIIHFNDTFFIGYRVTANSSVSVLEVRVLGVNTTQGNSSGSNGTASNESSIFAGKLNLSVNQLIYSTNIKGAFRLGLASDGFNECAYFVYNADNRIRLKLLSGMMPFNTSVFSENGDDSKGDGGWECMGTYYTPAIHAVYLWNSSILIAGQAASAAGGVKSPAFWQFTSVGSGVFIKNNIASGNNSSTIGYKTDYFCMLEYNHSLTAGGMKTNTSSGQSVAVIDILTISLFGNISVQNNDGNSDRADERNLAQTAGVVILTAGGTLLLGYILLVAAAERYRYSFFFIIAPLYSRISKENAQDNFTRGQILGYLKANPGVHYRKLLEALDIGNGNLTYHLRVLEKEGLIRSRNKGLKKYFFPADIPLGTEILILNETQRFILTYLKTHPGSTLTVLADVTGVSVAYCSRQVKELEEAGVIRVVQQGPNKFCYIAEHFFEQIRNTAVPRAIRLDSRFSGKPIL
ncbi:MAG: winged helix-turn-helix transcriptional regulator, partial [Thermoplasmata archaeon]